MYKRSTNTNAVVDYAMNDVGFRHGAHGGKVLAREWCHYYFTLRAIEGIISTRLRRIVQQG